MVTILRRHWLVIFLFLCCLNRYALNVNLSVAIQPISCQNNWSTATQGMILSSFFFGSLFGAIPGGFFASKYGGKIVVGLGIFIPALFTLLTPYAISSTSSASNCKCDASIASNWCFIDNIYTRDEIQCNEPVMPICTSDNSSNIYTLMLCRVVMGFFLFFAFPGIYALIKKWTPSNEISTMIGCTISGNYVATAFTSSIAGVIVSHSKWDNIFYFFGLCGMIWCVGWYYCIYDSPFDDPHISEQELQYLKEGFKSNSKDKNEGIPWMAMLTNKVAISIYAVHFAYNWMFYTLLTQLPLYLKELNYDLSEAGMVAIAPYIGQCIFTISASRVCDKMIQKNRYSLSLVRKIATSISSIIPAVLLVICGHVENVQLIVVLLVIACSCMGFVSPGLLANYSDISNEYSSIIVSVGNTIATLPGVFSPILGGFILQSGVFGWKSIFYITFILNIFGNIVYWTYAHAKGEIFKLRTGGVHGMSR
eukprot:1077088_1